MQKYKLFVVFSRLEKLRDVLSGSFKITVVIPSGVDQVGEREGGDHPGTRNRIQSTRWIQRSPGSGSAAATHTPSSGGSRNVNFISNTEYSIKW